MPPQLARVATISSRSSTGSALGFFFGRPWVRDIGQRLADFCLGGSIDEVLVLKPLRQHRQSQGKRMRGECL